jgi:flavin reductase (DIM6/NTAB) family NADH-FMN oxidoreductase RutF
MPTLIDPATLEARDRYRLTISLIVPRPIGWISTFSQDGLPNLAPYSFFNAFSASPLLVGASIGRRSGGPKDTLTNIRQSGVFVVNVVGEPHLEAMVRTSGDWAADVDEFREAGLTMANADRVDAPYVADAAAVLECRLFKEVDLGASPNVLIIGEVVAIRLGEGVTMDPETYHVDVNGLRPVGRLGRDEYGLIGEVRRVPRPEVSRDQGGG